MFRLGQHYCREDSISRSRNFLRDSGASAGLSSALQGSSGATLIATRPPCRPNGLISSVTVPEPAHQNALNEAAGNEIGQEGAPAKANQRQRDAGDR